MQEATAVWMAGIRNFTQICHIFATSIALDLHQLVLYFMRLPIHRFSLYTQARQHGRIWSPDHGTQRP